MAKQNVLLIINPVAGRGKARTMLDQIVDSLRSSGCKTTTYSTTQKGDAIKIVKERAREFQKIICCGGDGTLNEVFTGMVEAGLHIPVGYIPTGTTNDLAHALRLPTKIKKAIGISIYGNIRKHDIGSFNNNQYFSYVASFGAFTKAAYTTPQWLKNLLGRIAYFFSGIRSLTDINSHTVKVEVDGKEIEGDFIFGSVSNSTVVGGIVKFLESEVSFDDGKFEVLLIKNPKNPKELRGIIRGILHHHYDERYVYFLKASKVSFSFEGDTEWTIDGEYAGALNNVSIENLPRIVQIVTSSKSTKS